MPYIHKRYSSERLVSKSLMRTVIKTAAVGLRAGAKKTSRQLGGVCRGLLRVWERTRDQSCSAEAHHMIWQRDVSLHEGIRLLLERRYLIEAGILLLSQLESTLYLLHIEKDQSKASKWLDDWSVRGAPTPNVLDRINKLFDSPAREHYAILYRVLCMMKHANPGIEPNLFGSRRAQVPKAPRTKPETTRQLLMSALVFEPEQDLAHCFLGESCELLVVGFERLVDWYQNEIRSNSSGGALAWRRRHSVRCQWETSIQQAGSGHRRQPPDDERTNTDWLGNLAHSWKPSR